MGAFEIGGKRVCVHEAASAAAPVIYMPAVGGDGGAVARCCDELSCPDFTLVAIGGLDWNRELSPWECDAITRDSEAFGGDAEAFLRELTGSIVPLVEEELGLQPAWRGLAGYSLAGLFALWAATRCDMFSRVASVSGSLWFPGFTGYLQERPLSEELCVVYLSLGKKEHKTPNRMMCTVKDATSEIEQMLREREIACTFELNPGNHFSEPDLRCVRGIRWLLAASPACEEACAKR